MILFINMRKSQRKEFIETCATFFMRQLKLEKSKYTVLISSIRNMRNNIGYSGSVTPTGKLNILSMELDSGLDTDRLVEVIAHEFLHVKQIATGRLKIVKKKTFWLGKQINANKIGYYNHPWEIDVWKKEKLLTNTLWAVINKKIT